MHNEQIGGTKEILLVCSIVKSTCFDFGVKGISWGKKIKITIFVVVILKRNKVYLRNIRADSGTNFAHSAMEIEDF